MKEEKIKVGEIDKKKNILNKKLLPSNADVSSSLQLFYPLFQLHCNRTQPNQSCHSSAGQERGGKCGGILGLRFDAAHATVMTELLHPLSLVIN